VCIYIYIYIKILRRVNRALTSTFHIIGLFCSYSRSLLLM